MHEMANSYILEREATEILGLAMLRTKLDRVFLHTTFSPDLLPNGVFKS